MKLNHTKKLFFISSLVLPILSFSGSWSITELKTEKSEVPVTDSDIYLVSHKQFKDDMTKDQSIEKLKLNEDQLHEAQVWNLSEQEEKRYVLLMQNRSSVYYKNKSLSPVEILGMNARTAQERQKFASLAAEQNEQQIAQLLTWRTAFNKAYQKRTKDLKRVQSFDTSKYSPYAYKAVDLKPGDKVFLYLESGDPVKAQLAVLYQLIEETPNTSLELIFLDDHASKEIINKWAKAHTVPRDLVKQKRIQLNMGSQKVRDEIAHNGKKLPLVVHESQGSISVVDFSRL